MLEGWSLCDVVGHAVEKRDQWEQEEEEAPVISHQKWRLGDQRNAADAALLGMASVCVCTCGKEKTLEAQAHTHTHTQLPPYPPYMTTCVRQGM